MQTFVIRIHRAEDEPEGGLRGLIEETSTGTKATFHDAAELLAILTHRVKRGAPPHEPPGPRASTWPWPGLETSRSPEGPDQTT